MVLRVWGLGFRVWGLGFRVVGFLGLGDSAVEPLEFMDPGFEA